jgi:hypothetical protein
VAAAVVSGVVIWRLEETAFEAATARCDALS